MRSLTTRRRRRAGPDRVLMAFARRWDLAGASAAELGVVLRFALLQSQLELGQVARLLHSTHLGEVMAPSSAVELLPLPLPEPTIAEARVLRVMAEGIDPCDLRNGFRKDLEIAGRGSWMFLLVTLLNNLNKGYAAPSDKRVCCPTSPSRAQLRSLKYLMQKVDYFVAEGCPAVPRVDWPQAVKLKSMDYGGVAVAKAIPITWEQIELGLPRPGVAGSVPLRRIVAPAVRRWC